MSDDDGFRLNMLEGMNKFNTARTRAFWQEMIDHLRGKPAELLSFDDIRQRLRLREESYRGLQEVPLEQIVGSVGRYKDFTRNFLPRSAKMQERWSRVYAQANSMVGLPPIELYKIGDTYFVRDGNHRVSVARQLDAKTIQAHVTELPTTVDIRPGMTEKDINDASAYAAFLEETGLSRTRPHHQLMSLSESSRYSDLLGHICLHQLLIEHTTGRHITLEDAAADWYDNVYRPAVTLIRKYDMLSQVGARTEGDLYLWLVDHLREVREQFGEEAPSRKFSHALVDFLNERKLPVPEELASEADDSVILSRTQLMRAVRDHEQDQRNEEQSGDDSQGESQI